MPLQGHWERQHTPLRLTGRREVRILAAVAVVLTLAVAATVFAALRHGTPQTRPGCVDVIVASTTGGAAIHACGARAAQWCRLEATRHDKFAQTMRARCRRAGYP